MRNQFIFETESYAWENEEQTGGSDPASIRQLQQALNQKLGTNLPLDGVMSFRTRRALRQFQRREGLPADGIVRPETLRALFAGSARAVRPASEFEFEFETAASQHKFEDCTDAQKKEITAALPKAHSAVLKSAGILASFYAGNILPVRVQQLLNTHFHTTDRSNILKIYRNLFRIGEAFNKGLTFECEDKCDRAQLGYGYSKLGPIGDIHICFDNRPNHVNFSKLSEEEKVATIIHEAAHRYAGIRDKAYVWQNAYSKLSAEKAMNNADSYTYFCTKFFFGT